MTFRHTLLAALFSVTTVAAQQLSHPVMDSRADAMSSAQSYRLLADTTDVLAVMVQFQTDSDNRTSGNGQFDLSTPADAGLDSPPRNRRYFEDHLTFLANYFRKVSKGKTIIRWRLVDTVYTLGDPMSRYSPPKSGPNTVVGDLARDTWTLVSNSGKVQDFSPYECFVLFHAGVGRDIDLVGTLGYDPTPSDIPSLYLGLNAFKGFYGQTYQGIPVRNNVLIPNTIVMPETETRELPATPANVLLRLGINGLLCASVGNFLGLPDLFNTTDGRSGIGRFGLMDGQVIFSFGGAFPPEPSAWEKYWLGWVQPIVCSPGESRLSLPAVSIADSVYRVPISAAEYYLVENRNRDAGRNGQRVTISYNGTISQKNYQRDTAVFNAFSLADIRGNIVDIEDCDWSVPGGVNTSTNTFFDGGVLIWHIDETAIAQGLASNGVNANPNRRGVDLEEADGSQDIGQQYGQLEAGSGSEEGTVFDFWYQGNAAPVYRNEFSSTSYPNTASNSGANSHVTFKNFTARGPRMSVNVIVGDDVSLLPGFPKSLPNRTSTVSLTSALLNGGGQSLFVTTGNERSNRPGRTTAGGLSTIYAWNVDGSGVLRPDGRFAEAETPGSTFLRSVALDDLNHDGIAEVVTGEVLVGIVTSDLVKAYSVRPGGADSLALPYFARLMSRAQSSSIVLSDSVVALGAVEGKLFFLRSDGTTSDTLQSTGTGSPVSGVSVLGSRSFVVVSGDGDVSVRFPGAVPPQQVRMDIGKRIAGPAAVGTFDDRRLIVCTTTDGFLVVLDQNLERVSGFPIYAGVPLSPSAALADIDGDGRRDIIVFSGNRVLAYNSAGASLDNFPKLIPSQKPITSNPVVADVDGDGDVDIVAVSEDGLVVAYDKSGAMAKGFPLQAGSGGQSVAAFGFPSLALSVTDIGLAVASSEDGSVNAWRTGTVGANRQPLLPWPQYQHDARHTGLAAEPITGAPLSSAFFPKERAYNWPNPVYDGKTFIRYFIKENAVVKIKIYDVAGDLVTEIQAPGIGGVDNEIEWNVNNVQSGVYLARIEASRTGASETAIVKVAVVK